MHTFVETVHVQLTNKRGDVGMFEVLTVLLAIARARAIITGGELTRELWRIPR